MKIYRDTSEAWVTYSELKGMTLRKALKKLLDDEVITLKEYTEHTRKKRNYIYNDLDEKVKGCFEYHEYETKGDEGHHIILTYMSDGKKHEIYLRVRKSMWIEKGEVMKVSELLKLKRGIKVQDNRENLESNFDGWIVLKPKGKEKFKKVLDLEWWTCGSDTAIIKCTTKKEVSLVHELFDSIDGDCTKDEWNEWFREPTDKEWDKYEAKMEKKYGKSWQIMKDA